MKHKPLDDLNTVFGEAIQRLEENPDALTSIHIGALVTLAQSYGRQPAVAYFTRVLAERLEREPKPTTRVDARTLEPRTWIEKIFRRGTL